MLIHFVTFKIEMELSGEPEAQDSRAAKLPRAYNQYTTWNIKLDILNKWWMLEVSTLLRFESTAVLDLCHHAQNLIYVQIARERGRRLILVFNFISYIGGLWYHRYI